MLYATVLVVVLGSALVPSSVRSQTVDTARVRAAFEAVTARRNEYERFHGRFANVNGIRMHYLEWGDRRGVPLIWAHGSASTAYEIRAVAPRLAQSGYRVIAVDYRGHGLTRVTDFEFSIYHIADDLVALLDHLKIPAAVFGGASKGGFVAAAVYDQHPERVVGLLMADGGTWSNQWIFDHAESDAVLRRLTQSDVLPRIIKASEFEVFQEIVGGQIPTTDDASIERLLDLVVRIGPQSDGTWTFLPGFERMMGSVDLYAAATRPSTLPLLQRSQHAMIPPVVFRNLDVPMMILDPQEKYDVLPVTDQNERLARQHPRLIVHRIYSDTGHNVLRARPDWFVRDAVDLLDRAKRIPARRGRPSRPGRQLSTGQMKK
jgi:pimeloyl-ACP methyl ester carboxylesterase